MRLGIIIGFSVISSVVSSPEQARQIIDYQVFYGECYCPGIEQPEICLRKFESANTLYFLTVDPQNLSTHIHPVDRCSVYPSDREDLYRKNSQTPYMKAMRDAETSAALLQDAGITHTLPGEKGVVVTIDLCPSTKPLDRDVFYKIIKSFSAEEKPIPLAIAITGVWMSEHRQDIEWLKDLVHQDEIRITWINHSYYHRFNRLLPLNENFLLRKDTDLNSEILRTEIAMIEHGLIPSVFFRFPGLVSDAEIFNQVSRYGLIAVGSDSWLAKNYKPHAGSIVLIHGNGNEPLGIKKFLHLLQQEKENIVTKNWLLFDLSETLTSEELQK